MKRISITSCDKIYEIITLHQVPNGYFVSGYPKLIVNIDDNDIQFILNIKNCLDSSQRDYKVENNINKNKEFNDEVAKKSGYKTYNKFLENSRNVIINQEKKILQFIPNYYDSKKKSFFPDKSKEIIELPININNEIFFKTLNDLLN